MLRSFRTQVLLAVLLISGLPVSQAGEPGDDQAPSTDLLEFLGEWLGDEILLDTTSQPAADGDRSPTPEQNQDD